METDQRNDKTREDFEIQKNTETEILDTNEQQSKDNSHKWEWATTIAEGIPPSARGGHSATLIGKSIVIFGGHYYSDKNTGFVYLNDTHFLDVALSKWLVN